MIEKKTLLTLEFDKIAQELSLYAQSEGGKNLAKNLTPAMTAEDAKALLEQTEEADRVLFEFSVSPNFAIDDIAQIVRFAAKNGLLSIADILKTGRVLRIARGITKAMQKPLNVPCLTAMSKTLYLIRNSKTEYIPPFVGYGSGRRCLENAQGYKRQNTKT